MSVDVIIIIIKVGGKMGIYMCCVVSKFVEVCEIKVDLVYEIVIKCVLVEDEWVEEIMVEVEYKIVMCEVLK